MNSIERVKAALRFKGPDRAPVWRVGGGDVFVLAMIPPKSWNPGYADNEQGMFPYVGGIDEAIKFGLYRWKRPKWARTPENKKFLKGFRIPDEVPKTKSGNCGWGDYKEKLLGKIGEIVCVNKDENKLCIYTDINKVSWWWHGDDFTEDCLIDDSEEPKIEIGIGKKSKISNKELFGI